jgi:hypothetical protein
MAGHSQNMWQTVLCNDSNVWFLSRVQSAVTEHNSNVCQSSDTLSEDGVVLSFVVSGGVSAVHYTSMCFVTDSMHIASSYSCW